MVANEKLSERYHVRLVKEIDNKNREATER